MPKPPLTQRTEDAIEELTRYGGEVFNENLADALDLLADINDDLWNLRHPYYIKENVDKLRKVLDEISP